MTAVEFIRQEFLEKITNENYKKSFDQIIEQAKEMEKEQIIAACNEWFTEGCRYSTGFEQTLWYDEEQYYNETYKSE